MRFSSSNLAFRSTVAVRSSVCRWLAEVVGPDQGFEARMQLPVPEVVSEPVLGGDIVDELRHQRLDLDAHAVRRALLAPGVRSVVARSAIAVQTGCRNAVSPVQTSGATVGFAVQSMRVSHERQRQVSGITTPQNAPAVPVAICGIPVHHLADFIGNHQRRLAMMNRWQLVGRQAHR